MISNILGLAQELSAQLPIEGIDNNGNIHWSQTPTQEQIILSQNIIASFDPNKLNQQQVDQNASYSNYVTFPDWVRTMDITSSGSYIDGQIWNGATIIQANQYIDATATNLAGAIVVMKQMASAIIATRGILKLIAQLLICIRDITIRYR